MPRNMSFSHTTEQVRNKTKTVTRRKGWTFLKPGDVVNACVKCMGLKPGEHIELIHQIRITDTRREPLNLMDDREYGDAEAILEGFPNLTGPQFVQMFCQHMLARPDQIITRIQYEYVE